VASRQGDIDKVKVRNAELEVERKSPGWRSFFRDGEARNSMREADVRVHHHTGS
jgi:hypothetical protein